MIKVLFCFIVFLYAACFPFSVRAAVLPDGQGESLTLDRVMRHVYLNNPTLKAARAELRAMHEMYPQATAGWKPSVEAEGNVYSTDLDSSNFGTADGATTKEINLSITQPLYRGGKTTAEIDKSHDMIKAGFARMLQKEQEILLEAATVYMNVIRDRTLLNLRISNEDILGRELQAVQERFDGGDVTQTDVQQAEARLARAKAEHVTASGTLEASRAQFEEVVGFPPDDTLYIPASVFDFPLEIDVMISRAEDENPALGTSKNQHAAAEKDIDARVADLLPQISAYASFNKQYDPQPGIIDDSQTETIGVRAKIALYEAGMVRSRVREAKNIATQRAEEIDQKRRSIRQDIVSNLRALESARAEIIARRAESDAARAALEGVREESKMGERTVLDVLDADQDVLSADAALARASRDEIVASYSLAAALGWLIPEKMGMADITYQPGPHYRAMGSKIFSMNAEQ